MYKTFSPSVVFIKHSNTTGSIKYEYMVIQVDTRKTGNIIPKSTSISLLILISDICFSFFILTVFIILIKE